MIKDLLHWKKFNGKICVVVSAFDVASGRVGVQIKNMRSNNGKILRTLNIKPINLHDEEEKKCLIKGYQKKNDTHYLPPKHNKNSRPVPTICMGVSGAASSSDMFKGEVNKCTDSRKQMLSG